MSYGLYCHADLLISMPSKKILLKTFFLFTYLIIGISSPKLLAEELRFIPRGWVGVLDYSFDQSPRRGALPDGSDFPKVEFDATLLIAGIGLTTVFDRFYLDLSYQDSSEEEDSFSGANYVEKFKGDRRDYSTTLGMRILDNRANVYFGYKNGKTSGRGEAGTQLTFEESGFFIGGSYGWVIANKGFLVINLAYADLDGNLKEVPGPRYPSGLSLDADSEAEGLSYGISWSGQLSEKTGYSIALDANQYDFENLHDSSATEPLPNKVEETMYTGRISITYRF